MMHITSKSFQLYPLRLSLWSFPAWIYTYAKENHSKQCFVSFNFREMLAGTKNKLLKRSQAGGGLGPGDHFLSYKFIQRTIERWANFTKQLLIASWGHQAPRKAAHCLRKEVGQNIKDKKRGKGARDGDPSREGRLNRGSFQTPGKPSHWRAWGKFSNLRGELNWEEKLNKTHR